MNIFKIVSRKKMLFVVSFILVLALFAGCTSDEGVISVGSKDFTEQLILGQIAVMALEDAGYQVEDKTNVAGSDKVYSALTSGEIDLYWEYTGTAWLMHHQNDEPITDSEECYEKAKEADAQKGLVWLDYAPFNNTYTIMMQKGKSEELGIKSISELAEYINENSEGRLIYAGDHEFTARPDGLPALEKTYGFQFEPDNMDTMDVGIIYKALKENEVDIAMGHATDARVEAYDLVSLEDDKQFFPVYNPAIVIREEALGENPEIADIFNNIAKKLDTETMLRLNYEVDIEEREPSDVAREWLETEGLI